MRDKAARTTRSARSGTAGTNLIEAPLGLTTVLSLSAAVLTISLTSASTSVGAAQRPDRPGSVNLPSALTIPYLANASKPGELDYAAAECDVAIDRLQMTCRFRQLFITPVSFDATTCAVTTNGFERTFTRASTTSTRWTSEDSPQGPCGLVDTHTLDDGGGTRWTLTIATRATRGSANSACQADAIESVVYDWRTMKRALPCTNVQPGMIER